MTQPALRAVEWRDLTRLGTWEVAIELARPLPWLAASLIFAAHRWDMAALASSFFFFLAGLRLVHDAFHYSLSLPRRTTEWVIAIVSALMLGSMHAVQIHHLRHHTHCLDADDLEGSSARMSAWRAVVFGPRFTWDLHRHAWRLATRTQQQWIALELAATAALAVFALAGPRWLAFHAIAMAIGHCLTAFFAVWTVHHDCDGGTVRARTLRSRWKSFVSHEMFFHVEHHLFPAVPTQRLSALAARLDEVMPEAAAKKVW